jgi:fructose-1,6-bisphosphatase I
MTSRSVVTIERHIIDQERQHPGATGALSDILSHMALSAKLIAREVNKAGLVDILGRQGTRTSTASRSRSWTSSPTT